MNLNRNIYRSPASGAKLDCRIDERRGDEIVSGVLHSGAESFPIDQGIVDFVATRNLSPLQRETRAYYDNAAANYDDVAHLSFTIQNSDETATRRKFIDLLDLKPGHRVLELACGTGRDSVNIAARLGASGAFYLQDISRGMLAKCREKLRDAEVPLEFSVGDACALPFPDACFDAVFSFGGIGVFDNIAQSLGEIVRVAKPGARVAVGDESLAPWLYETEYGRILLNNNPLFKAELPLRHIPREARDVRFQWVVGGVYYMIDFTVGRGDPDADFDLPIPGARGGTLRTRYEGRLEGVSAPTLQMVRAAAAASGRSMHDWLEAALRASAERDLGGKR